MKDVLPLWQVLTLMGTWHGLCIHIKFSTPRSTLKINTVSPSTDSITLQNTKEVLLWRVERVDIRHSWTSQRKTNSFLHLTTGQKNTRLNGRETSSSLQDLDSGQSLCSYIFDVCMHTSVCMYTYSWRPVWVKNSRWALPVKENKKLQRRVFNVHHHFSPEDTMKRQAKPSELHHKNWSFEMAPIQPITDRCKLPETKGSYRPLNITPAASQIL